MVFGDDFLKFHFARPRFFLARDVSKQLSLQFLGSRAWGLGARRLVCCVFFWEDFFGCRFGGLVPSAWVSAFFFGVVFVGVLFTAFRLPLPAPPTFAGVCGIFGVFFGYKLFLFIVERFF